MKKIFTVLSAAFFIGAVSAQTEVTLSQTNDDIVPEGAGILSCNDSDNGIFRLFNLNDYGITGAFEVTGVDAAAIIWDGGYGEVYIYNYNGPEYPESIAYDTLEDTGFYAFYSNNSGVREWQWVSFEVFDEATQEINNDREFAVVLQGPISNADDGWIGSMVPLPTDGGFIKSSYFGSPNTGCYAVEEGVATRLDTTTFTAYAATLLTVTGIAEGMGLVELGGRAFSIYPNPATDVLNIKLNGNEVMESIEIVNMAGQSVMRMKAADQINVSSLAPGAYVLRMKDNNGVTHMEKLIKK